jgi:hypothetical protein
VASTEQFYRLALKMLDEKWDGRREIRLVGVGVAQVEADAQARQGELFGDKDEKRRRVEEAALDVNARYGKTGLTRARLLHPRSEDEGDDDRHRR